MTETKKYKWVNEKSGGFSEAAKQRILPREIILTFMTRMLDGVKKRNMQ